MRTSMCSNAIASFQALHQKCRAEQAVVIWPLLDGTEAVLAPLKFKTGNYQTLASHPGLLPHNCFLRELPYKEEMPLPCVLCCFTSNLDKLGDRKRTVTDFFGILQHGRTIRPSTYLCLHSRPTQNTLLMVNSGEYCFH